MWSGSRSRSLLSGSTSFSWDAAWLWQLGLGVLLGFFQIPFVWAWLVFLPLTGFFYLLAMAETPRVAAKIGFWVGLGFWAVHLFWLPLSLSRIFGSAWLFPLIAFVWPIEAAMWAGAAWLAHRLGGRALPTLGVLAGVFVLLEWFRTWFPAPFPWGNFGYALVDTPFAQAASLGGVYGLSLMVTVLAAALAALAWQEWWPTAAMVFVWVVVLVFGLSRPAVLLSQNAPNNLRSAILVQGDIDPLRRATGKAINEFEIYSHLTREALHSFANPNLPVVIWPEASVSQQQAVAAPWARFVGGVWSFEPNRVNAIAAIRSGKLLGRSSKQREVPFGECVPLPSFLSFIYQPIYRSLGMYASACGSAPRAQVLQLDSSFAAFICYDSIFPDVPRNLVRAGATVLLEAANDGWFGGGMGNAQHFLMDKIRAIETNRFFLRATNTGITALIDPRGKVVARLPQNHAGALPVRFVPITDITPYVRFGDWPLLLALALVLALMFRGSRPQRLI